MISAGRIVGYVEKLLCVALAAVSIGAGGKCKHREDAGNGAEKRSGGERGKVSNISIHATSPDKQQRVNYIAFGAVELRTGLGVQLQSGILRQK